MLTGDTIAAVSTPPGSARRALIRLSGPDAIAAIDALLANASLAGATSDDHCHPPGASVAVLRLGASTLPVRILRSHAPRSYTGEHAAEVILPGNPVLVDRVIDALCAHAGERAVRRAGPGEFTARAYLNGRLSLEQARGVGALVAARTDAERRAAAALLDGTLGAHLARWLDELTTLLALVEAGIDFTEEEDVVAIEPAALRERAAGVRARIEQARPARERESGAPLIALLGPPSAGKSTLFNALLGSARVVTHADPGTTRDAIIEPLDCSTPAAPGLIADLADLPGLETPGASDASLRQAALACAARADLVLLIDDAARFEIDAEVRGALAPGAPTLRVRTKADRPLAAPRDARPASELESAESPDAIEVCALDGRGLGELRDAIARALDRSASSDRLRFGADQAARLAAAIDELNALAALLDARADVRFDAESEVTRRQPLPGPAGSPPPEVLAEHLRGAIDALGAIAGRVTDEDILGRVFATFCVGK